MSLYKADLCCLERFATDQNLAEKHLQCIEEKNNRNTKIWRETKSLQHFLSIY